MLEQSYFSNNITLARPWSTVNETKKTDSQSLIPKLPL